MYAFHSYDARFPIRPPLLNLSSGGNQPPHSLITRTTHMDGLVQP